MRRHHNEERAAGGVVVPPAPIPELTARLSTDSADITRAQRLRYDVFARGMGATVNGAEQGLDVDAFDSFCEHVLIEERASGDLVGTTRLLSTEGALAAGRFYSQTEFAMEDVLAVHTNLLEIGRTCVHADHRGGAVLARLWGVIGDVLTRREVDALIGCASIPMGGPGHAQAVVRRVQGRALSPAGLRVAPLRPLPHAKVPSIERVRIPPLLLAYLRMGAQVCGDAYWDRDFDVADVLVLLERDALVGRYGRRFLGNAGSAGNGANM